MLMHNMPTNILTLPRTVITPQTSHTLPTRPTSAKTARPTTAAHPPFLQCASCTTIECNEGTEYDWYEGT